MNASRLQGIKYMGHIIHETLVTLPELLPTMHWYNIAHVTTLILRLVINVTIETPFFLFGFHRHG